MHVSHLQYISLYQYITIQMLNSHMQANDDNVGQNRGWWNFKMGGAGALSHFMKDNSKILSMNPK